eukprot:s219_g1.t1
MLSMELQKVGQQFQEAEAEVEKLRRELRSKTALAFNRVEHHKNGNGDYVWQWAPQTNDGKVREKMGKGTLREKDDEDGRANHRVSESYQKSSGSYNVVTDNCQHASKKAYDLG